MATLQDRYDDAMFAFSSGDWVAAAEGLRGILAEDPLYLDARLALGMTYCRMGNYPAAIEQGHLAEKQSPDEQLVHTNLSLFYLKLGDKAAAEHHGLKARIASWKQPAAPAPAGDTDSALEMAKPPPPPAVSTKNLPPRPEMPWKKNKSLSST